ncbi:MAG: hypothetical protein ACXWUG_26405 [Polyangiales bacterium]
MRRRLAPPLVVIALAPSCARNTGTPPKGDDTGRSSSTASAEPPEKSWTEFRNGICTVIPDCSPPAGTNINPCNPPPPQMTVPCPPELLPTQPPGTKITTQPDGTCWVECDDKSCDAPGPLRVQCPSANAPAPEYATAISIPKATTARYDTGVFHRRDDLKCDLVECEAGTKCANPPGRTMTDVPCPPELMPTVANGVVPIMSSKRYSCFYGHVVVACPKRFHVWH